MNQCSECGAQYALDSDSCAHRFDQLLALDHSRREPWGSRHGQAFAVFALQHPERFPTSLNAAWTALYRIYILRERPSDVFTSLRLGTSRSTDTARVPHCPAQWSGSFAMTIADLEDFAEGSYAKRLDDWCAATLRAYGQSLTWPRSDERRN